MVQKPNRKRGFTLAELLIVVAIIGVLVTIAIPVFTSSLEKAREATCLSNRTSLEHEVIYAIMMESGDPNNMTDQLFDQMKKDFSQEIIEEKGYICPGGGTISIVSEPVTRALAVSCTEHKNLTISYDFANTIGSIMDKGLESKIVELFQKNNRTKLDQIDSTAPDGGNYAGPIRDKMAELTNHSIGQGMTQTWALLNINRSGNIIQPNYQVYWSSADISTCKAGDKILMMSYDASQKTYAPRWVEVKTNSAADVGGGKPYNIIDSSKSESIPVTRNDFDTAYEAYQAAARANGNSAVKPQ